MKPTLIQKISITLVATAFAVAIQAAQVVPVIEVNQNNTASNYALSQNSELIISLQQLQDEVRQLRGQVESQQYKLTQMETDQKVRYRDLDRRISLLVQSQMQGADGVSPASGEVALPTESALPSEPAAKPVVKAETEVSKAESAPKPSAQSLNLNDQKDYQSAFALVRERDFDSAADSFERFLTDYPDSPRVPNAYYWLGEIYLAQGNHQQSEEAFLRVADQYSDSRKAADALYKLGILYKQQGDLVKSMSYMSRVAKEYPETSAARLAESALSQ
ncbi:tol-pal system protein YbgF [Neptunomonas antarctica]|uniref:Cell division coordinator CpoB n=1 Tax=Neptunomonas antarctica TaxID=619304 RepID=A0A1N7KB71_9GAMM|nr:tol-pal system protein YbgF [Neptunomonas antarctica]SIS58760.1 tol-pal system protein YbgF [Neptunomonas antarctica]